MARTPATKAACCATSSAEAVPAASRAWMARRIISASPRLRRATAALSCKASAWNQVEATLVTTVSATASWSNRLASAPAAAASCPARSLPQRSSSQPIVGLVEKLRVCVVVVLAIWPETRRCELWLHCSLPPTDTPGSSATPASANCASAWRTRAKAAWISKLPPWAASISPSSVPEPKPRHHAAPGQTARAEPAVAR